jgi:Mlc titration factor MtfA (ptsG expression regulator)
MSRQVWVQIFSAAYEDFCTRVDGDEETSILRIGERPSFRLLSEAFFELPDVVQHVHPGHLNSFPCSRQ